MISLLNRYKRHLQLLVPAVGLLFLLAVFAVGYIVAGWDFSAKTWKEVLETLAKPAEAGLYALIGLFVARKLLPLIPWKEIGRALYRLLQIVHVPLGLIVAVSGSMHGLLFVLYRWESDFHHWSGVAGLVMLLGTSLFGLFTIPRPGRKRFHRTISISAFLVLLIHIATA